MLTLPVIADRVASELKCGCIYSWSELRSRQFFTLWPDYGLINAWEYCSEYDFSMSREVRTVVCAAIQIEMDARLPKSD